MAEPEKRQRLTLAILALGGQGGGVLANWVAEAARASGWTAQGTSVPGVAQRTGSTVYYVEMLAPIANTGCSPPVLALMPVPGDVDVVIAPELMEAGRAVLRGFATKDRTTLIASTHRIYAISERGAMFDARAAGDRILDAARRNSKTLVSFDMERVASEGGSFISAVMFGALAASGALPFDVTVFEGVIGAGRSGEGNLRGFAAGAREAQNPSASVTKGVPARPSIPSTSAGLALQAKALQALPDAAHAFAIEGISRLMDYQDREYANLYLSRLATVHACDDGRDNWALTRETARHLALWMAYEDIARVAELKTRSARTTRVRDEVRLEAGQILEVEEFLHPRLREVCDSLPSWISDRLMTSRWLRRLLEPLFAKGRLIRTSGLRGYLLLRAVAGMRRWRRSSPRFRDEQERIAAWLDITRLMARSDAAAATEVIRMQELVRGYGDTMERGLERFNRIIGSANEVIGNSEAAAILQAMRLAALSDESGDALEACIASGKPPSRSESVAA